MKVTRQSPFSGKLNTRDIPCTEEQLNTYLDGNWPIQRVLGFLSAEDREFIMTGITPEEWAEAFPDNED